MIASKNKCLIKLGYPCLKSDLLSPIKQEFKEINIKRDLHKYSNGYLFNSVKSKNSFISSHRVIIAYSVELEKRLNKVISANLNKLNYLKRIERVTKHLNNIGVFI